METFLPSYLEMSMEQFTRNREQFREGISSAFGGAQPFNKLEEQIRQNTAMFEQAIRMFSSFPAKPKTDEPENTSEKSAASETGSKEEISELKDQLASLQSKLDELNGKA